MKNSSLKVALRKLPIKSEQLPGTCSSPRFDPFTRIALAERPNGTLHPIVPPRRKTAYDWHSPPPPGCFTSPQTRTHAVSREIKACKLLTFQEAPGSRPHPPATPNSSEALSFRRRRVLQTCSSERAITPAFNAQETEKWPVRYSTEPLCEVSFGRVEDTRW